jgi:hypothetical protein
MLLLACWSRECAIAGFDECPPKRQSGLIPLLPVTFGLGVVTIDRPHDGRGGQWRCKEAVNTFTR